MAIKGLSKPIAGFYKNNGAGVVNYEDPFVADHLVEYSFEANVSEDNDLYADNRVQESAAGKFADGSLTVKTADLMPELSMMILKAKEVERKVGEKTYTEIVFDDEQNSPYLGYGVVEEHENDGITTYLPIWFPKVKFNIPAGAATTRGTEIEWQTREITAKVMRSDQNDENYQHPWQISPKNPFTTEEEAVEYLFEVLGKKQQSDTEGQEEIV